MVQYGALGFKAFMIESGVDEFPMCTEKDLAQVMPMLAQAGVPLLVHAEVDTGAPQSPAGSKKYQHYLESRPQEWEVKAIQTIIRLAAQTGCRVHVVHLSAARALGDIREAKKKGVPITVETCPHYLFFESEKIDEGKTQYKCAPPIREHANREALWNGLQDGVIDFVVSDHSPCSPHLKRIETGDFGEAWGGIAGLQFSLPTVWSEMKRRGLSLRSLSRWMSQRTAQFAGLHRSKGQVAEGFDADLVIWDPEQEFEVEREMVLHRHNLTPYEGAVLYGRVSQTFVRGQCVYRDGVFPIPSNGAVGRPVVGA